MKKNREKKLISEEKKSKNEIPTSLAVDKPTHRTFGQKMYERKVAILFVILLLITPVLIAMKASNLFQKPHVVKTTIMKEVVSIRSKNLGLINRALTGKAVDVNTGKIVTAARIFTVDDKSVYLELDLNKPPQGTAIDYIRYKHGRYVDHGEITIQKNNIDNVLFSWSINQLLASVINGDWKIATYTNGILDKRVLYQIKSNKLSDAYEEKVNPTDSDYKLGNALSFASYRK